MNIELLKNSSFFMPVLSFFKKNVKKLIVPETKSNLNRLTRIKHEHHHHF